MDGSLTGASESDVDKQQLTARVPLNGCPRGLTPNFSAAMEDCNLDAVKRPSCRIYHTPKTGRVVGLPLSKYSRAQHRTLLSAFQRRAAPRSMAFTKVTTQAAHLCESRRPGAAASRFWAAAGVSSGLVDGVKAPCPISKLPEIEARTVLPVRLLLLRHPLRVKLLASSSAAVPSTVRRSPFSLALVVLCVHVPVGLHVIGT